MSLRDLPVKPTMTENHIRDTYIAERNAIQTEDDLRSFTKRWKAIWVLHSGRNLTNEEKSIINGTYDATPSLKCLKICLQKDVCEHASTGVSCVGMHLSLPITLMMAEFISQHFGVTTDIAIIQANGGMGELET